jgi:hypothetical protein
LKRAIFILLIAALFAGCGSNFEWFPKDKTFQNNSTAAPVNPPAAEVVKTLNFPGGVTWISDLAYDPISSSFWLLVGTSTAPTDLVNINADTGVIEQQQLTLDLMPNIIDGSMLAFDGDSSSFLITSNGYNAGVLVSEIYRFDSAGTWLNTYDCPATDTGFCQGLAWDSASSSFWVAGSDNKRLVNFRLESGVLTTIKTYTNLWSTNGVSDIGFDRPTNQLLVLKGGMIPVDASNGKVGTRKSFILPGTGRGDWDGTYFWIIDNVEKKLKAVVVN